MDTTSPRVFVLTAAPQLGFSQFSQGMARDWRNSRCAVPDGFTDFTSQPGLATNTVRTSIPQTITGINAAALVSIANGSYAINCTGTFTNQPGSISNNQTTYVRHSSAASASSTVTTTLTIGGVSGSFSSITAGGSFLLTVNKAGSGSGNVTSTLPALPTINCG